MSVQVAARTLLPRPYWADDAACRGADLAHFYGTETAPLIGRNADPGRSLCQGCYVQRDCLLDALRTNEQSGLRGGYLGHERAATMERVTGSVQEAMAAYDAGTFYVPPRRAR